MFVDIQTKNPQVWALDSYEGSAHFFFTAGDYDKIVNSMIFNTRLSKSTQTILTQDRVYADLIISNIDQTFMEHNQLIPYVGDYFAHYFFGASPVILNITAALIDTTLSIGKLEFLELYRWLFRLSQVAKTGVAPYLAFVGCLAQGAMLDLNITESGSKEDNLSVQFQYLVFSTKYINEDNKVVKASTFNFTDYNKVIYV